MTFKCFFTRLLSIVLTLLMLLPLCAYAQTDVQEEQTEPLPPERTPLFNGIDVSRWQEEVDFHAVKAAGIDFVIIRIGYWDTKDFMFDTHYRNAVDAGLDVGVYIYSYAKSREDAAFEAENVLTWLEGRRLEYPVFYDIEDAAQSSLSKEERTAMCLSFSEVISEAGYLPGIYTTFFWFKECLDTAELEHLPLWMAMWNDGEEKKREPGEPYDMWQYSSVGTVEGINDNVDLDACYFDYPAYVRLNGLNGYEPLPEYDPELPFTDVSTRSWYYEYVKYTFDRGLFNGMSPTLFAPEADLSRGMFVTVLGRMYGADPLQYTASPFLDVDMTEYYGPYVQWAYESGIADGVGMDMFAPDERITREQMCKMIAGYLSFIGIEMTPSEDSFKDDALISDWAREYVYLLSGTGIIGGVAPGVFSPGTNATRAQSAAIIKRVNEIAERENAA